MRLLMRSAELCRGYADCNGRRAAPDVGGAEISLCTAAHLPDQRRLGTMGFGMGAANGACIGTGRKTVLFTGDGSFAMNFNELGTAVTEGLPVIVVLMDNGVLGMVRQLQRFFSNGHYSQTTTNRKTDFVAFARAMGAEGYRATTTEEMADAMQKAKAAEGPVVIACEIDREDMVYPNGAFKPIH